MRRHHRAVLGVAALLAVVALVGVSRLSLRTSLEELLPSGDDGADAVAQAKQRVGDLSSLVVAIRSSDPAANVAYAERLAPAIEALGPRVIERAVFSVPEVHDFFTHNRWLYADESLIRDLIARIRFERQTHENPLFVPLDEPPTLEQLKARLHDGQRSAGRLDSGVLATDEGRLLAIVVIPGTGYGNELGAPEIERAVREAISRVPPPMTGGASPTRIDVRLAGDVHTQVAEREAIEKDVAVTSAAVVVLVALIVWLYFGRARAIVLMALPAMWGALLSLGFAGFVFGVLNSSTAFLGGIIVGNGINYPILLLARYDEERALRGANVALSRALAATARPTALAAFAASVAYGSLALTRFRGFSQFGVIGALGMALCWLATMVLLPAMLVSLDHGSAPPPRRRVNFGLAFATLIARPRRARAIIGVLGALTVGTLLVLPRWFADPYDWDFRHLRRLEVADEVGTELDQIFGRALSPSLVLTGSPAESDEAKRVILSQAARLHPNPVAHVVTVDDLVPGSPDEQRRKIALARELRDELAPERLRLLSTRQQADLSRLRPPADLVPISLDDVPSLAKRPFRERGGSVGNVVLVYPPRDGFSTWNGHDLFRLSDAISRVPLEGGTVLHAAGKPVIFSSMIGAIAHDGPLATLASFTGVSLLAVLLLRRARETIWVLGSLTLGVLWMLGVAALWGVKLNFLNFIALPITFGIGVDYAANVVLRYRQEGRGSIVRVLGSTGGAVVLNSGTTTIGYAALLVAHNRALRSFGALSILGEFACLSAAMLILPSWLALRDRRRARVAAAVLGPAT